ncbi:MAG: hypothetical protein ACO1NX_05710 [Chitinophagaceae bacterium]
MFVALPAMQPEHADKMAKFEKKLLIMNRQAIIERTLKAINQLPDEKAAEISDFAEFMMKQYEEQHLSKDLQQLAAVSQAFDFLNNEEDIYTEDDLKEKYNG